MTRNTLASLAKAWIIALVLFVLAGAAQTASATPITWTLSGATFSGGGVASGSFGYDANTDTFSFINITVTGAPFGNATYTSVDPGFGPSASLMAFVPNPTLTNFIGTAILGLNFSLPLTNAGGTIGLTTGIYGIQQCTTVDCSLSFTVNPFASGNVSSVSTVVPEPASLILFATGLLGAVERVLRRNQHG